MLHVNDIMHTGAEIPRVFESTLFKDALLEMSGKGLGTTAVVDKDDHVIGIFTDGDVRRALDNNVDVHNTRIGELISGTFKSIDKDELAATALARMEECKINALLVIDNQNKLIGILNMHDLLRARVL